MDNLCDTCRGKDTCKTWLTRSPGSVIMDCTAYNLPPISHTAEEVTRYCSDNAPRQCLNEKCAQAEVFKDKLYCTATGKWWDLTPNTVEDVVNHPSHYETGKFECIDVMRETQSDAAVQDFCICNALKYIYRHRNKNGVEDIRKAKWYIDKYLEIEEEKTHQCYRNSKQN